MKSLINQIYESWMNSPNVSSELKSEMMTMSKEEINNHFNDNELKFGTAGIRAIIGPGTNRINKNIIYKYADAYAKFLKISRNQGLVVIAHDNRRYSKEFSNAFTDVLTSYGFNVKTFVNNNFCKKDIPMATPILSYFIKKTNAIGGVNVTSSHNPKEYNGFKLYNEHGSQYLVNETNKISSLAIPNSQVHNLSFVGNNDLVSHITLRDVKNYYFDARASLINKAIINYSKKYPIIFTGHHGTSTITMPKFLKSLNYVNVISVKPQCKIDCNFTNSPCPNPEDSSSFKLAEYFANIYKSKIIVATDPDADRAAIAIKKADKWYYLTGNEMGIIFTYYILKNKKFVKTPYIVSTYVSNNLIDRIARDFSAKIYRTNVGFKWIANKIMEIDDKEEFVVGFEEAIGALPSTLVMDKDSFQTIALALEIYTVYQQKGMDFIDILEQEIYPKYGHWYGKTISHVFTELNWKQIAAEKINKFKKYPLKNYYGYDLKSITFNDIAGCLEWNFDGDSWIKFRMSGTEPKLKIYYNLYGSSQKEIINKISDFNKMILKN